MIAQTAEAEVAKTRFIPWLARFRPTGRGEAELRLERADDDSSDPRASTAAADGLKVAIRGVLYEREELARELRLEPVPAVRCRAGIGGVPTLGPGGHSAASRDLRVFIWDGERERLLAARDHARSRAVVLCPCGEEILFAASPKTLLAQPGVQRAPNRTVLVETLYWQWPCPEDTCLEGIRRILPGHITGRDERYDVLEPLLESVRRPAGAGLGGGRRARRVRCAARALRLAMPRARAVRNFPQRRSRLGEHRRGGARSRRTPRPGDAIGAVTRFSDPGDDRGGRTASEWRRPSGYRRSCSASRRASRPTDSFAERSS